MVRHDTMAVKNLRVGLILILSLTITTGSYRKAQPTTSASSAPTQTLLQSQKNPGYLLNANPSMIQKTDESLGSLLTHAYLENERWIGHNISAFITSVHSGILLFQQLRSDCGSTWDAPQFFTRLTSVLNKLEISSAPINHKLREMTEAPPQFFPTPHPPLERNNWTAGSSGECELAWESVGDFPKFLNATHTWFIFLAQLNSSLASYEVQDRRRTNDTRILRLAQLGTSITDQNLSEVFKAIYQEFKLPALKGDSLKVLTSSQNKLRRDYVQGMLTTSLGTSPSCTATATTPAAGGTVTVKGPYLFLSEALSCLQPSTTHLILLATHRIFVDRNLDTLAMTPGRKVDLSIISPSWLVIHGRTIALNGINGPKHKVVDEGKPGLAGGNGGNFFGIFREVTGSLDIVTRGGRGGSGQRGGNSSIHQLACPHLVSQEGLWCCAGERVILTLQFPDMYLRYNGTGGGQGGHGGFPGLIKLISLEGPTTLSGVRTFQLDGKPGTPGQGGRGRVEPLQIPATLLFKTLHKDPYNYPPCEYKHFKDKKRRKRMRCCTELYLPLPEVKDGEAGGDPRSPPKPPNPQIRREDIAGALSHFKVSARKHSHLFSKGMLMDFIEKMEWNPELREFQGPLDLMNEFKDLERSVTAGLMGREEDPYLGAYYDSLAERARAFASQSEGPPSEAAENYLFLSAAAKGRKLSLFPGELEPILVVNLREFLEKEQTKLDDLRQISRVSTVAAEYMNTVERRLKELNVLVHEMLLPEIDVIGAKLKADSEALLTSIREARDREGETVKRWEDYRKFHQRFKLLFIGLKGLQFLGDVITFFRPALGIFINGGAEFVRHKVASSQPVKQPVDPLPPAVESDARKAATQFYKERQEGLRALLGQLEAVEARLKSKQTFFSKPLQDIQNLRAKVLAFDNITDDWGTQQSTIKDLGSFAQLLEFRTLLSSVLEQLSKSIEGCVTSAESMGTENHLALIRLQAEALNILESEQQESSKGQDGNGSRLSKSNVAESSPSGIQMMVDLPDEKILERWDLLNEHLCRVENEMIPEVHRILAVMGKVGGSLSGESASMLATIRWRLQSLLRDTKLRFQKAYTEGTGMERDLLRGFEKLEDAFTTLIGLYERIEGYKDQLMQANLFARMSKDLSLGIRRRQDPAMQAALKELEHLTCANAIVQRVELVRRSFEMWRFPFPMAEGMCRLVPQERTLSAEEMRTDAGVETVLNQVQRIFRSMLEAVDGARNTVITADKDIVQLDFSTETPLRPFFTWHNSTHAEEIGKLLDGEPVTLFASTDGTPPDCSGVKARRIEPVFTLADDYDGNGAELDTALKTALNGYTVRMVHQGNSYYRLEQTTVSLPSERLEFLFSFVRNADGSPRISNNVFKKLASGDVMISPYRLWEFKLSQIPNDGTIGLSDGASLERFKNRVDFHLVGSGVCYRGSQKWQGCESS